MGEGGRGEGGRGGGQGRLSLVLANRPLAGPRFPRGGYPFEAKKRVRKMVLGVGRIWRGVPVLTTYTPPARGLGGFCQPPMYSNDYCFLV